MSERNKKRVYGWVYKGATRTEMFKLEEDARENPAYGEGKIITLCRCQKCCEWYEADVVLDDGKDWTHVCGKRNSWRLKADILEAE